MTRGGDNDDRQYRAVRIDTRRNVKMIGQASKEVVLEYGSHLKSLLSLLRVGLR